MIYSARYRPPRLLEVPSLKRQECVDQCGRMTPSGSPLGELGQHEGRPQTASGLLEKANLLLKPEFAIVMFPSASKSRFSAFKSLWTARLRGGVHRGHRGMELASASSLPCCHEPLAARPPSAASALPHEASSSTSLCWGDRRLPDSCFAGKSPEAGGVLPRLTRDLRGLRLPGQEVLGQPPRS